MAKATRKRRPRVHFTPEQLLQTLRVAEREKGKRVTQTDCLQRKYGLAPLGQYEKAFGSLNAAIAKATEDNAVAEPTMGSVRKERESRSTFSLAISIEGNTISTVKAENVSEFTRLFAAAGDPDSANVIEGMEHAFKRIEDDVELSITARKGAVALTVTAQ